MNTTAVFEAIIRGQLVMVLALATICMLVWLMRGSR